MNCDTVQATTSDVTQDVLREGSHAEMLPRAAHANLKRRASPTLALAFYKAVRAIQTLQGLLCGGAPPRRPETIRLMLAPVARGRKARKGTESLASLRVAQRGGNRANNSRRAQREGETQQSVGVPAACAAGQPSENG